MQASPCPLQKKDPIKLHINAVNIVRACRLIHFAFADIGAWTCSWTKPCGTSCLRCAHPALTMILRMSWAHPILRSTPVHLSSPQSESLPQQQRLQVGLQQAGQGKGSSMSGQNPASTKAAAAATVPQLQLVLYLCLSNSCLMLPCLHQQA